VASVLTAFNEASLHVPSAELHTDVQLSVPVPTYQPPLLAVVVAVVVDVEVIVGQDPSLHTCVCDLAPQRVPPRRDCTSTLRVRVCTPLPQVAEHDPKLIQASKTQSTGHAFRKQADV
jgi:hypothetical protein